MLYRCYIACRLTNQIVITSPRDCSTNLLYYLLRWKKRGEIENSSIDFVTFYFTDCVTSILCYDDDYYFKKYDDSSN